MKVVCFFFEGQHEVMILTKADINIEFKGDFLIRVKDVATVLEYQGETATNWIKILENCITQEKNFISNLSLNRVLGQSAQPKAMPLQDWLYEDILPSIQKHGIYATDNVIDNILNNPDFGIELLTKLKEERASRIQAERTNAILMHVNKTYTATEIAKEIGFKSANALNRDLEDQGIQFKQNDTWLIKIYEKQNGIA